MGEFDAEPSISSATDIGLVADQIAHDDLEAMSRAFPYLSAANTYAERASSYYDEMEALSIAIVEQPLCFFPRLQHLKATIQWTRARRQASQLYVQGKSMLRPDSDLI